MVSVSQPRFDSGRILEDLNELLDLSSEQSTRIEKILKEAETEIMSWDRSSFSSRSEFREKRMTLMKETDERIKEVLTGEQRVKYEEFTAERRNDRQRGRGSL
jgi:Spy/CpxP family protein refolding chaperone